MFSLFKSKLKSSSDSGRYPGTDMHSHILPGIDDGAATVEDSLQLVEAMRQMGCQKMIATPHISEDMYPNTPECILAKRDELRETLDKKNIPMQIEAAAEYMIDEQFLKLVEKENLLTIDGDKQVLVEMSYLSESPYLFAAVFKLQTHGYQPVLAHPERYQFYFDKPEAFDELLSKGCIFQLNALSLSGYYGKMVQKTAAHLIRKGHYSYIGSDVHHLRHTNQLNKILGESAYAKLDKRVLLNEGL